MDPAFRALLCRLHGTLLLCRLHGIPPPHRPRLSSEALVFTWLESFPFIQRKACPSSGP